MWSLGCLVGGFVSFFSPLSVMFFKYFDSGLEFRVVLGGLTFEVVFLSFFRRITKN